MERGSISYLTNTTECLEGASSVKIDTVKNVARMLSMGRIKKKRAEGHGTEHNHSWG